MLNFRIILEAVEEIGSHQDSIKQQARAVSPSLMLEEQSQASSGMELLPVLHCLCLTWLLAKIAVGEYPQTADSPCLLTDH